MINYAVEIAIRNALSDAMEAQYNKTVKAIAEDIIYRKSIPALYSEDEINCYLAGAVAALMWMTDDKAGFQIEYDINLEVSNIEAGVIE